MSATNLFAAAELVYSEFDALRASRREHNIPESMARALEVLAAALYSPEDDNQEAAQANQPEARPSIQQITGVLEEICTMDNGIKNITLATLEARGEEAGALISMTGNMAEKIGWIADLCIQKTGGIGVVGNAGDWMLNPSSRWLVEPGEQSGHA